MKELTEADFTSFLVLLKRVPSIGPGIGFGHEKGSWWVKFTIDISHPLAWEVVQEFGHILNYLSLGEPLSTVFYPVSPPPYMNGGPEAYLSWIIENTDPIFLPGEAAKWLLGRLPNLDEWGK